MIFNLDKGTFTAKVGSGDSEYFYLDFSDS